MAYLYLENMEFKDYRLNLVIENKEVVGVYSRNKKLVSEFLRVISGINKTKSCLYQGKEVFDNREYFQNRISLDYAHTYLSTLRIANIEEALKSKYSLSFNKEKFIKIGRELDIRGETEITFQYKFSPAGNTFVNYALTVALEKPNVIIENPTYGLNLAEDIEYIVSGITDKSVFNTAIIELDRLRLFKNRLQKILIFSDFNKAYFLDPKTQLVIIPEDIEIDEPLYTTEEGVIGILTYTKGELKILQKNKIDYRIISIYDLEEYL